MNSFNPSWSFLNTGALQIVCGIFLFGIIESFSANEISMITSTSLQYLLSLPTAISSSFCRSALWMRQKDIKFAEYCLLKKLNTSYFKFLLDLGSTLSVFLVPVVKWLKGCRGFAVALSTCNRTVSVSVLCNSVLFPVRNEYFPVCRLQKIFPLLSKIFHASATKS